MSDFKLSKKLEKIENAKSIEINQIVYSKRASGEKISTFSLGEAVFDIPIFPITDEDFQKGYRYSSSLGVTSLREKIASLYNNKYGASLTTLNNILISAGSKSILYMTFLALLDEGDEVVIPEPAWLSYKEQVALVGAKTVNIAHNTPIGEWHKYLSNKAKCIVINNPNNPSGKVYSRNELCEILDICKRYNLVLICDEAYSDFVIYDNFVSIASIDPKFDYSVVVNSLSKNMGMSGWRVGYCLSNFQYIRAMLKLNQHIITCAPTFLQEYMSKNFDEILKLTLPQVEKLVFKRLKVQDFMRSIKLRFLDGGATFYFMIDVGSFNGTTDQLVNLLINKYNIAVVNGGSYGDSTSNYVRFAIGAESFDEIKRCLLIIKRVIE